MTSKLFVEARRIADVVNDFTSTYNPQTSGHTERLNRTLTSMLRHYLAEDQASSDRYLPALSCAYNRGVHRYTGKTRSSGSFLDLQPLWVPNLSMTSQPSARNGQRLPFYGNFVKDVGAQQCLSKTQKRYKRDFDKSVSLENARLRAGDSSFLDTPADKTLQGRCRNKPHFKTVVPYTVLAHDGPTIFLGIDGVPECINSGRVLLGRELATLPIFD